MKIKWTVMLFLAATLISRDGWSAPSDLDAEQLPEVTPAHLGVSFHAPKSWTVSGPEKATVEITHTYKDKSWITLRLARHTGATYDFKSAKDDPETVTFLKGQSAIEAKIGEGKPITEMPIFKTVSGLPVFAMRTITAFHVYLLPLDSHTFIEASIRSDGGQGDELFDRFVKTIIPFSKKGLHNGAMKKAILQAKESFDTDWVKYNKTGERPLLPPDER